jgi:hypothetical protein
MTNEPQPIDRAIHLLAIIAAAYPGDPVSIAAGEDARIELRDLAGRDLAWVMLRQVPPAARVALAPMLVREG